MTAPAVFAGMLDDAAIFPPGEMPLPEAVGAHGRHRAAPHSELVGPFVVRAADIEAVAARAGGAGEPLALFVTTPLAELASTVRRVAESPAVRLAGVEVVVPDAVEPEAIIGRLRRGGAEGVTVAVEVPRDARRSHLIAALSEHGFAAKLRTGGVRADLYPDETELADAIAALVAHGVPFKATAGLHHAIRNTDVVTGFEQHGFLNVLVAAGRAAVGASATELRDILAERDPDVVVGAVRTLDPTARRVFRSFGTCSIEEPITELIDLGLLPRELGRDFE